MKIFIIKFSKKLQEFAKHHLLIFAFGMLGLLILAGTVIINFFWGGSPCLPPATNSTDNKDYITLYIAMLGVVATLYGSFVVIYAYAGWKEQVKHEKSLTALIDVSATFAKLHRAIIRLKLEKKHTNFNKNYKDDDFIKKLVERRSEFDTEVDKITVIFDELDFAIKALYLVSERKDSPFKSVSDEYFKITHVWKDIYLRLLGTVNDGHINEVEYIKLIKEYEYRLYYIQVKYDPHEDEIKNHNDEPIFLSMKHLKGLNEETNKLIEEFRESL